MSDVVVVTGAAKGIGRAICEQLSQEGRSVVAVDIDEAALTETAGALGDWLHPGDGRHRAVEHARARRRGRARRGRVDRLGQQRGHRRRRRRA